MKNIKIKYAQSRLQRNVLLASAFLLLSALVWFDKTFHPYLKSHLQSQQIQNIDTNDWDKYNEKVFTVVKVVDGDTIDINIPDGNFLDTRIRLLGVDTPETKNPKTKVMYFGPEASKFTSDMVLKKTVFIVMDANSNSRDKYHRLLAHIRLSDGRILNEELISEGFAYADPRFPQSYNEKYLQLEKEARKEKKGLWEKVKPDQMPKWRTKINN